MRPYVVKQGDYLAKIAYQFGFDPATVWMDDTNSDLRDLRYNPNILAAGDILYIPDDATSPTSFDLDVGQTNSFTGSDPPVIQIVVQFNGTDANPTLYASQPFQIVELPDLTGLETDGDGVAKIDVPVTLSSLTLTFSTLGVTRSVLIADMDPVNTLSGIYKRLQHLGFLSQNDVADPTDIELLRAGLRMLKASAAPDSDSAPPSSSDDGSPDSDSAPPSSSDDGSPDSDSAPPSSSDDGSPDSEPDDAGLSDAGVLDDETMQLLIKQHGS